ncbi:MAG: zinc ribbon domain-containing protein [Chloroflexi bacterium]|nr:zinc ribbon domain-containing protein [Chloroflexota bacterium]
MPLYEYVCPTCDERFEELRPIARAEEEATCARGHVGAQRAISVFATIGGACAPSGPLGGAPT